MLLRDVRVHAIERWWRPVEGAVLWWEAELRRWRHAVHLRWARMVLDVGALGLDWRLDELVEGRLRERRLRARSLGVALLEERKQWICLLLVVLAGHLYGRRLQR